LRLNPRPNYFLQLITAHVNYGAGRHEEAMELLERVRLANPDNLIARIALAAFYGRAGRREEARAAVREALQVAPDLTSERALQLIPGLERIAGPEEFARYPDTLRTAGLP
jgi:tetratricopeptide (TPR) repeat protein